MAGTRAVYAPRYGLYAWVVLDSVRAHARFFDKTSVLSHARLLIANHLIFKHFSEKIIFD